MAIKFKVSVDMRKLWNLYRKANSMIKKAIKPLAKDKKNKVKSSCPVDSGALKKSIDFLLTAKGGKSAAIIVGPKTKYAFTDENGEVKIPNLYAKKVDEETRFISDQVGQGDVDTMRELVKDAVKGII